MARGILDKPWFYFALAGALLLAAIATQFEVRTPGRAQAPVTALTELRNRDDLNVIFLLVDTLRADRLGIYGYERPTSQLIDELARTGIVFERAVSQSSWTKTSMASLWTGTYPIRNGVLRYNHVLPDEATVPAELFLQAGYRTAGLWRNGWVEPNFGFSQGFEVYVRPTPGAERERIHRQNPSGYPLTGTDEDMTTSAVDFLHQFGNERFFLYMHYMDVHQYVYDDKSAVFGTSYSDAYDQSIHWVDRLIGVLFSALRDEGLLDRTLVVIAADHGEAFLEHGSEGHARNLYEEVTHVPFIIVPPFIIDGGVRVPYTVSNADIWPTVLDLVGLPPLPGADGRSLVPLILASGGADPGVDVQDLEHRTVYAQLAKGWGRPNHESEQLVSVTTDGRRLIETLGKPETAELYDHASDPHEKHDLIAAGSDDPKEMRALLDTYVKQGGTPPWGAAAGEVELDEMRLNHLRALGYVIKPD